MKTDLLSMNGVKVLNKKAKLNIIGGIAPFAALGAFDCHCLSEEHHARILRADSISDALNQLKGLCGDLGGVCTGIS